MPLKDLEKRKEYHKEYYSKNKEKIKEYSQSPIVKKKHKISKWKQNGLIIADNIDEIYDRWLNSTECELCSNEYTDKNKKCLDHDHNTGLFRNVVCHSCNVSSKLKEMYKNNTSGYKNIVITKWNTFQVSICINKKIRYTKTLKTLEEAIEYRDNLI